MKNIILGSVLAIAAVTPLTANAAQTFCNAPSAAGAATVAASVGNFIKSPFTPKCSANVFLVGDDVDANTYRVGSASSKGKNRYGGMSGGGSVSSRAACAANPCAVTDAASGASEATS